MHKRIAPLDIGSILVARFTAPKSRISMPTPEQRIEQCLAICDQTASELKALKTKTHKTAHDRQFARQIDYALRTTHRIADRIRALDDRPSGQLPVSTGDRQDKLIALAKALRPVIKKTPHSAWQQDILRQIDDLTRD